MHELEIKTEEHAEILYNVLRHEKAPRCKVDFTFSKGKLTIKIMSQNISSLRAAANSFLKWIDMVEKILEQDFI